MFISYKKTTQKVVFNTNKLIFTPIFAKKKGFSQILLGLFIPILIRNHLNNELLYLLFSATKNIISIKIFRINSFN